MAEENYFLFVITLNVNGLKSPVKIQRLAEWKNYMIHLHMVFKRLIFDLKTQIL